jgi:NTP pyrophosphatase (non-canonical NTP hydrolase)
MNFNEYQQHALRTAGEEETKNAGLCMASMGLSGEAGETTDYIKKVVFHGHLMDKDRVKKELGDVLWYLAVLADKCGLSLDDVADANVVKLKARYPAGFDPVLSQNRKADDK